MCTMAVLCPLCTQASFTSIDALRVSLIKAANGPLPCPICHELFLGLDKLTIHLFSHTSLMNNVDVLPTAVATTTAATTKLNAKSSEENAVALPIDRSEMAAAKKNIVQETSREQCSKKSKQTQNQQNTWQLIPARSQQPQPPQPPTTVTVASTADAPSNALATCDVCEFTFRNEQLRDMHFRLVHKNTTTGSTETNAADTNKPKNNNSNKTTLTTVKSPAEHEFKCHLCAKTFKMKGSLRVHLKVVHLMGLPNDSSTPKQTICERIRRKANSDNKIAPPPLTTVIPAAATFSIGTLTLLPSGGMNMNGTVGGDSVLNINGNAKLVSHAGADSGNSNVLLVFNATNLATSTATTVTTELPNTEEIIAQGAAVSYDANPKIWECDVCTKSFTTKYFLKKHKRLHTGEMPYTCELCGRTFTFQQSYHKHLLYHNDEKPHVCTTCGRAFKELSTLHNHERIHSGEKPFKCEVCGKSFRQRVSFLVHTRIHTGVMPYKCELCQKTFRYKVSQRTHKCITKSSDPSEQSDVDNNADQMSDSFIKAFLESNALAQMCNTEQQSPASHEIASITANSAERDELDEQALLSKSIDEIVVESCNKMGIGESDAVVGATHVHHHQLPTHNGYTDGSNSPSEKLQNMRLYSPQLIADMTAIDTTEFPHFLLDDTNANIL